MAPTPSTQLQLRKKKPGPGRIVVSLPSPPPPYQPGSGPPLQRIHLLPPRDSTAYIVERILLPSPGPAADGKPLPKRMAYIVGWTDLPAASVSVPAMEVLQYVSPRALEEWEANMELELDKERRILVEEKESVGTQKKARPPAHTNIESAAVADIEEDTQPHSMLPAMSLSAMSLSTPKKRRLEDFEGFTDYEEGSPSGQLTRESAWREDQGDTITVNTNVPNATGSGWPSAEEEEEEENDAEEGFGPIRNQGMPTKIRPFASASATQYSSLLSTQTLTSGKNPSQATSGGFTPFNQNRRYSMPQASRLSSVPSPAAAAKSKKQSKPRKESSATKKKATKVAAGPAPAMAAAVEQQDWGVKTILDADLFEVEGIGLVRYFQVLWEGDWPPDQNPTWEPEENIPPNMVRNYFKRGKKRKRKPRVNVASSKSPSKSKKKATTKTTTTTKLGGNLHYGSVSEAFAGDLADNGYISQTPTGDDDEELVVDEDQHETFLSQRR
ncbi:hypothetical protein CP533_6782 [Ophiocordyceps camponoti-saundersi (nom. inval.)]|nr:hypothetical protein CP533_6782 [Ophiocordyceps camponoti-saundersi (nom. inval.)]